MSMFLKNVKLGDTLVVDYPEHNKHGQWGVVSAIRLLHLGEVCVEVSLYFEGERFERTFKPKNLCTIPDYHD